MERLKIQVMKKGNPIRAVYDHNGDEHEIILYGGFGNGHPICIIDARPDVPGRWIKSLPVNGKPMWRCSECERKSSTAFMYGIQMEKYCYNCGARMKGESDE